MVKQYCYVSEQIKRRDDLHARSGQLGRQQRAKEPDSKSNPRGCLHLQRACFIDVSSATNRFVVHLPNRARDFPLLSLITWLLVAAEYTIVCIQ